MTEMVFIWAGLFAALVIFGVGAPGRGGVLVLSYFLGLSLIHVPGALIYLDPGSVGPHRAETELGFQLTLIGMAAFVAGVVAARWTTAINATELQKTPNEIAAVFTPHVWTMIVLGAIGFFFLIPRASFIPSGAALVSSLGTLIVLGLGLRFYIAYVEHSGLKTVQALALVPILPVATLTNNGIVSYGVSWALTVGAFLFVFVRRRIWIYLSMPFAAVAGASLFATYLALRTNIRDVVWNAQSSLTDRLESIAKIPEYFSLLDLSNPLLVFAIDSRLNQNYLVGLAAQRYLGRGIQLAYGSTVQWWAFIPRFIWPDKPPVGGGLDVVTNFTGIVFQPGTSVGAGQVFEFYVNFATPGIIAGFLVLGYVLMRLDLAILRALQTADLRRLILCAMPGLTLIQPGGNLLEILVALIGALVVSRILTATQVFSNAPEPKFQPGE